MPDTPTPEETPVSPLTTVDPASLALLFDEDPHLLPNQSLDAMIGELRRRADAHLAEVAREQAAPKTKARRPRAGSTPVTDLSTAIAADKPVSELTVDDLFGD